MIIRLFLVLCLFGGVANAAVPIGSRPYMFLTTERINNMEQKKNSGSSEYQFTMDRTAAFLSETPYSYAEMSAAMALLYTVDPTLTSRRDRAIELALDYFVNRDSGQYYGTDTGGSVSTLSSGVSASETTISVVDGYSFNANSILGIGRELIKCSGYSDFTFSGCSRGYANTTPATHNVGAVIEATNNTFGEGDKFRSSNHWLAYIYDWLYDELTAQQRSDMRDTAYLWGKYWAYISDAPSGANVVLPYARTYDSDLMTAVMESLLAAGYILYGDDDFATELFDLADDYFTQFITPRYLDGTVRAGMQGGVWGEGSDYNAATTRYLARPWIVSKETRGMTYPVILSAFISGCIEGWAKFILPSRAGIYLYRDMEAIDSDYPRISGHTRLMTSFVYEAAAETAGDADLARWFYEQGVIKDGEPTSTTLYTGMFRLLLHYTNGNTAPPPNDDYESIGVGMSIMDKGLNTDRVYLQGQVSEYDHVSFIVGSIDVITGDGVYMTKKATGYDLASYDVWWYSSLGIEGQQVSDRGGTQGSEYWTDRVYISESSYEDDFAYVKQRAEGPFNFSGYSPETSLMSYSRRVLFAKDASSVVVFDHVQVSESSDCTWNRVTYEHTETNQACNPRWKQLHQRFQSEPVLSSGVYSATTSGKTFLYKPLLPVSNTITLVNEKTDEPWASETMSTQQKVYHTTLEPTDQDANPATFLTVQHWGESGETMPPTVTFDGASIKGVYVAHPTDPFVATFAPTEDAITDATFSLSNAAGTVMYLTGFNSGASVDIELTGANTVVETVSADTGGVVRYVLINEGSTTVILGGGAVSDCSTDPSLCLNQGDCSAAGWNWCTDTCQSSPCPGETTDIQIFTTSGSGELYWAGKE